MLTLRELRTPLGYNPNAMPASDTNLRKTEALSEGQRLQQNDAIVQNNTKEANYENAKNGMTGGVQPPITPDDPPTRESNPVDYDLSDVTWDYSTLNPEYKWVADMFNAKTLDDWEKQGFHNDSIADRLANMYLYSTLPQFKDSSIDYMYYGSNEIDPDIYNILKRNGYSSGKVSDLTPEQMQNVLKQYRGEKEDFESKHPGIPYTRRNEDYYRKQWDKTYEGYVGSNDNTQAASKQETANGTAPTATPSSNPVTPPSVSTVTAPRAESVPNSMPDAQTKADTRRQKKQKSPTDNPKPVEERKAQPQESTLTNVSPVVKTAAEPTKPTPTQQAPKKQEKDPREGYVIIPPVQPKQEAPKQPVQEKNDEDIKMYGDVPVVTVQAPRGVDIKPVPHLYYYPKSEQAEEPTRGISDVLNDKIKGLPPVIGVTPDVGGAAPTATEPERPVQEPAPAVSKPEPEKRDDSATDIKSLTDKLLAQQEAERAKFERRRMADRISRMGFALGNLVGAGGGKTDASAITLDDGTKQVGEYRKDMEDINKENQAAYQRALDMIYRKEDQGYKNASLAATMADREAAREDNRWYREQQLKQDKEYKDALIANKQSALDASIENNKEKNKIAADKAAKTGNGKGSSLSEYELVEENVYDENGKKVGTRKVRRRLGGNDGKKANPMSGNTSSSNGGKKKIKGLSK